MKSKQVKATRRRGSSRWMTVATLAVASCAGVVGAGVASASTTVSAPSIPSTSFDLGGLIDYQGQIAYDGTDLWIANWDDSNVVAVNLATDKIVRTVRDNTNYDEPWGLATANGYLYVGNQDQPDLAVVKISTGATVTTVPIGSKCADVLYAGGYIWSANAGSATVTRINPTTYAATTIALTGTKPTALAYVDGDIWVAAGSSVAEINPTTASVIRSHATSFTAEAITAANGKIWVSGETTALPATGTVVSLNASTLAQQSQVTVGQNATALAFDGTALWVGDATSGQTSAVSPVNNTVLGASATGTGSNFFTQIGSNLLVSNQTSSNVSVIPLTSTTDTVLFASGSSTIVAKSANATAIEKEAAILAGGGYANVNVLGYSDASGSVASRQAISVARANAVATALRADLKADHDAILTVTATGAGTYSGSSNPAQQRRATITAVR